MAEVSEEVARRNGGSQESCWPVELDFDHVQGSSDLHTAKRYTERKN